jgi:hypothetical protein
VNAETAIAFLGAIVVVLNYLRERDESRRDIRAQLDAIRTRLDRQESKS